MIVVTELEIGYSARSTDDYERTRARLVELLVPVLTDPRAEPREGTWVGRRGEHDGASVGSFSSEGSQGRLPWWWSTTAAGAAVSVAQRAHGKP